VIVLLLCACGGAGNPAPRHHGLLIRNHYMPSKKKGLNRLRLYRVNLMALDLVRTRGKRSIKPRKEVNFNVIAQHCRDYIQWYLNHLNPVDRYGLSGSADDYQVYFDGREQRVQEPAPVAKTAAVFIILVHRFYKATGYRRMIVQRRKGLEDVAYIIPYLMDQSGGLLPDRPGGTRFPLDTNCLAYAAMDAFAGLSREFGWGKEDFYEMTRDDLKTLILEHFYRENRGEFYWQLEDQSVDKDGVKYKLKYAVDKDTFQPDGISQLFPVLFDLPPRSKPGIGRELWRKFRDSFKGKMKKQDLACRMIYKWTAKKMGEEEQDEEEN
jgi:hypothetical protein